MKRQREETSESVNSQHKRLRDQDGKAQHVDPNRFFNNNNNSLLWNTSINNNSYNCALQGDDTDNDKDKSLSMDNNSNNNNNNNNNDDMSMLLYELASLDVGQNNPNNNLQTCPICSKRISLKEFSDHVYTCLDRMDKGELNDMRSQVERDYDYASSYAIKHGYSTDFTTTCPICNKALPIGCGINEHVNYCIDAKTLLDNDMKHNNNNNNNNQCDNDEDIDIQSNNNKKNNNNDNKKVEPLNREQMIQCANALMSLPSGGGEFNNMLHMFGALGFTAKNVKSVLEIEKNKTNNNNNNNNNKQPFVFDMNANSNTNSNNSNSNNNNNNNNDDEDDDLLNKMMNETVEKEYTFDDVDIDDDDI